MSRNEQEEAVEVQTVEVQTIEEQTVEVQTVEEQTVEEQTVEEQTAEEQTVEEQTVEEQTVEEQTAEEQTVEEQTVEEQTVEEQTVEVQTVEVQVEATTDVRPEELRILEAMLFASAEPLGEKDLAARLPEGADIAVALERLREEYAMRGVNLVRIDGRWTFRTATDLSWLLSKESTDKRKLSRAAIETLAIIAYHQPVTRSEIEELRGVSTSAGSIDVLLETGWVKPRGRRKSPGRPLTYGTTSEFLSHFGLDQVGDLPGLEELKGSGMFDGRLPPGFSVPMPSDDAALREDEDPLEPGDLDLGLAPPPERAASE